MSFVSIIWCAKHFGILKFVNQVQKFRLFYFLIPIFHLKRQLHIGCLMTLLDTEDYCIIFYNPVVANIIITVWLL